ncbi:P-type Cu(+) transporter [Ranunculus cassubicifolius]
MALKDLQLTTLSNSDKSSDENLEDVRLLDSYDDDLNEMAIEMGDNGGMKRIQIRVTGMTCAACSNSIETALMGVKGVIKGSVSLLQNKADVVFDPQLVKVSQFLGFFVKS